MVSSYLLSSTLVPVLSTWVLRRGHGGGSDGRLRKLYARYLDLVLRFRWPVAGAYVAITGLLLFLLFPRIGTEIFPATDATQFQIRLRAPTGTRVERTEIAALRALDIVKQVAGPGNVAITTDFVGVQASSYPINTIYLFTSGQHEAVLRVQLKPGAPLRGEALKERLRNAFREKLPDVAISFEAGDIISQVMSFGSPTPIKVDVQGPNQPANRAHAARIFAELGKLPELRDLEYAQPLDYPDCRREHRPGPRRAVRPHHGGCGALPGGGHFLEPRHRPQLLARSEERQCVSDPGRDPAEQGRLAGGLAESAPDA